MKNYLIDSTLGWMVVRAKNKRLARQQGVAEFGRGSVKWVREATEKEVIQCEELKGKIV